MLNYFIEITKERAISVSEYVNICLYNNEFGYYKKNKLRVGKAGDFYTSTSLNKEVFEKLLIAAAKKLLGETNAKICEIGAEPEGGIFQNSKTIKLGEDINLEGKFFLFSNEFLDAQPFDRFKFENGKIFKTFLKFTTSLQPDFSYAEASENEYKVLEKYLKLNSEKFFLDFSFVALNLLEKICAQNWQGTLIFADYFRSPQELIEFPNGTGRIFKNHKSYADIFLNPSECDITFSHCFSELIDILKLHNFTNISCQTQGQFFMENASDEIKNIIENYDAFAPQKRALAELLTPAHLGDSFRVLCGVRKQ